MNKQLFCEAFCSKLLLTEVPIGFVLRTPFQKSDGDAIAIYIRKHERNPNLFRMEDDGETLALLESQGVDFDSETRMLALAELLKQHNSTYDETNSLLHTEYMPLSELANKSVLFVSLMNRIWDLALLAKNRVKSTFKDDLVQLVEAQFGGAKIRVDEPLRDSMKDYLVDIIVELSDGKTLAIFAGTSELKALEALLFWREQKDQSVPKTRSMLVLESAKPKEIKERTLSRIINSDIVLASMDGDSVAVKQKMQNSFLH
jgi:Domain of unknown function DUF1828